jgi:hypothetical protein
MDNQEKSIEYHEHEKRLKQTQYLDDLPVNAVQSMTKSPTNLVYSINICNSNGSFSLEPLQGMEPLISCDSFVTKLCRTLSIDTSIPRASSSSTGCNEKAGSDALTNVFTMEQSKLD